MKITKQKTFFAIILLCLFLDQATKYFVDNFLSIGQKITMLPSIFSIEKTYNTGAAFSILQNNTVLLIFIAIITLSIISFIVITNNKKLKYIETTALGFIAGGATGNLIDRIIFNHVIDFIQTDFVRFPIFNFADIFINIGAIILLYRIIVPYND